MINLDNWTHAYYTNQELKAIVSFGADYQNANIIEEYFVTVIDEEGHDIFQQRFNNLEDACTYLNTRYEKIWNFADATKISPKEGGCSTCVAH